jgi:hypothetical protein
LKTQLIPLETHDDVISIRDKMSWAKTPRMLLVWPAKGRVDVRPLDLTLLRRHATSLGAELGLVTRDAEICASPSIPRGARPGWICASSAPCCRSAICLPISASPRWRAC